MPKRLLRSVIEFDSEVSPENLVRNFQLLRKAVEANQLEWGRPEDIQIYKYTLGFFIQHFEMPSAQTVSDYFQGVNSIEAIERIKDIQIERPYARTNFVHLLRTLQEDQARIKAVALLKETHEILVKGVEDKRTKEVHKGLEEAILHFTRKSQEIRVVDTNVRIHGDVRKDGLVMKEEYEIAENDKSKVIGVLTGLNEVDENCKGVKKGELWIHAGYPGELKCLAGDATVYDHRKGRLRTLKELFDSKDLPIVTALDREGITHHLVQAKASHLIQNGIRAIFDVELTSGRSVGATSNHKFFTTSGWKSLDKLAPGSWIAVPAVTVRGRPTTHADTLSIFSAAPDVVKALDGDLAWEQIKTIQLRGREMTYDLAVPKHHSFVVNDIVTHNTSLAINWCYNAITRFKKNVVYVSFEMPLEQIRRNIYTIHTTNARFAQQGFKSLDYRNIRDGLLTKEEKAFYYDYVIPDFLNNPTYTHFEVVTPDREWNMDDVRSQVELLHKEFDVGLVVLDHGQWVEARKSRRNKDYVIEINSVINDAKNLALHFDHNSGVPVLMLFQINRQGKELADKNDGAYKMSALTYANNCCAKGTLISTDKGLVPIEDIKIGTKVWSHTGWEEVLSKFDNGIRPIVEVKTELSCVKVTQDHRFRTLSPNGLEWTPASNLLGAYALSATMIPQKVISVKFVGDIQVYDLEVTGNHEYTAGGLLVHNCEKTADVITTTYLNDALRAAGLTKITNLKNRDNPLFKPFEAHVNFVSRRILSAKRMGPQGFSVESHDEYLNAMDVAL